MGLDRKTIVRLITFFGGLFFLLEFLIPGSGEKDENFLTTYMTKFNDILMVVAAMAFMLGPINLIRSNVSKLIRSHKEWLMPTVFFAGLAFGLFAGICYWTDAKMQDLAADSSKIKSGLDEWVLTSGILSLLLIWRHKGNIQNLLAGKESRIGSKKADNQSE